MKGRRGCGQVVVPSSVGSGHTIGFDRSSEMQRRVVCVMKQEGRKKEMELRDVVVLTAVAWLHVMPLVGP